jgi:nucleoid-associated protein YgaU
MRGLVLALLLACGFGAAALWQREHFARIDAERRALEAEQDALAAPTPSGTLSAGQAVLVIGRPSGAQALARPAAIEDPPTEPAAEVQPPSDPDQPAGSSLLDDSELEVQPGQTLSGIAHLYYGKHGAALLSALARYNGLADANSLRAGAKLRLPPLEVLEQAAR